MCFLLQSLRLAWSGWHGLGTSRSGHTTLAAVDLCFHLGSILFDAAQLVLECIVSYSAAVGSCFEIELLSADVNDSRRCEDKITRFGTSVP